LALAISKTFNYSNILTQWDSGQESINALSTAQYALKKKISLGYDFVDMNIVFPKGHLSGLSRLTLLNRVSTT